MEKIPIVACSVGSPTVEMLIASHRLYASEHKLIVHYDKPTTFGENYNNLLDEVFRKYDEVIVANDDIVLNPTCTKILIEDVNYLKKNFGIENKLGFVGAMHDMARPVQNIRYKFSDDDVLQFEKWKTETLIKQVPVVAPIFAYLSREAFSVAKFPLTNWYSDDIICEDLTKAGFYHFISTSYVHHVGSATLGPKERNLEHSAKAMMWIKENRPEHLEEMNKRFKMGSIEK